MLISLDTADIKQAPEIAGIYVISHTPTGLVYVGCANNIRKRWLCHMSLLKRNRHHNDKLQALWNESQPEDYTFSIIECVKDISTIKDRENYWIRLLQSCNPESGFNVKTHSRDHAYRKHTKPRICLTPEQRKEVVDHLFGYSTGAGYGGIAPTARKFGLTPSYVGKLWRDGLRDGLRLHCIDRPQTLQAPKTGLFAED